MSRIVHLNGDWLPEAEAKVSVFDRGFLMADGVYEVTSVLDGKLIGLRRALQDVQPAQREARLADELSRQADLALRITGSDGQRWYDSSINLPQDLPQQPGLSTISHDGADYRVLKAPLDPEQPDSPQLTLLLDITHHQHFLQRMQRLIWLTVGLSALATALLGIPTLILIVLQWRRERGQLRDATATIEQQ